LTEVFEITFSSKEYQMDTYGIVEITGQFSFNEDDVVYLAAGSRLLWGLTGYDDDTLHILVVGGGGAEGQIDLAELTEKLESTPAAEAYAQGVADALIAGKLSLWKEGFGVQEVSACVLLGVSGDVGIGPFSLNSFALYDCTNEDELQVFGGARVGFVSPQIPGLPSGIRVAGGVSAMARIVIDLPSDNH
jgi:hypothetical protein